MDLPAIVREVLKDKDMSNFVYPNKPSHCTWRLGADPKLSPHTKVTLVPREKILPNILHAIGHTPLVRLNNIPKQFGVKCEMLVKCEFLNPGGSVKDRIGYRMVEDAEKQGLLKPGDTIIEPTSGNTGIGLALAAAVKGYKLVIVMPEKMSDEKLNTLKALGAYIVRTPTAAAFNEPEGLIAVAQRLNKAIPNSHVLNQYTNSGNPLAHYDCTGEEIVEDCNGKVDVVVMGTGTGGTISGVARKLKERVPNVKIVGVDPYGSILAEPPEINKMDVAFYEVEGIGYDFIPTVLDRSVIDFWCKSTDQESLLMSRRLIREEGLLCGGSSGAVMSQAVKVAATLREDQRCVVILPDNIRNYMTKFVSDSWMEARSFIESNPIVDHWWWSHKVSSLNLDGASTVPSTLSVQETVDILRKRNYHQVPVLEEGGKLLGVVTSTYLLNSLVSGKLTPSDPVFRAVVAQPRTVPHDATLGRVSKILEAEEYVVVLKPITQGGDGVAGIITQGDLLAYITSEKGGTSAPKRSLTDSDSDGSK